MQLSPNTQVILLLTAPLIAGQNHPSTELLTSPEYMRLARFLRSVDREPADLLADAELLQKCGSFVDTERLERLLARGFLLSQAIARWQSRAIWVISRADAMYPSRARGRSQDATPPVLYGCGDAGILATGGLGILGSRHRENVGMLDYAVEVGTFAASAGSGSLISGGRSGTDQAATEAVLHAGGRAVVVIDHGLERAALVRTNRELLMSGRLLLLSSVDPSVRADRAAEDERDRLIVACSDAVLVLSADYQRGSAWARAVEQIEQLRGIPVFVRATGSRSKGLEGLRERGAQVWEQLPRGIAEDLTPVPALESHRRGHGVGVPDPPISAAAQQALILEMSSVQDSGDPAAELFAKVTELLNDLVTPRSEVEVAAQLGVLKSQARDWLDRLVAEGVLEKLKRPARYRTRAARLPFLGDVDDAASGDDSRHASSASEGKGTPH